MIERDTRWRRLDTEWSELARITRVTEGWMLSGDVQSAGGTDWFPPPFSARYEVMTDRNWASRELVVTMRVDGHPAMPSLALKRPAPGQWILGEEPVPSLDGATDVDLFITPATNSLPLRRLQLPVGASSTIVAALISVDDPADGWVLEANTQRYERITEEHYHFTSLDTNGTVSFAAELIVRDGVVTRYGDHWELE